MYSEGDKFAASDGSETINKHAEASHDYNLRRVTPRTWIQTCHAAWPEVKCLDNGPATVVNFDTWIHGMVNREKQKKHRTYECLMALQQ